MHLGGLMWQMWHLCHYLPKKYSEATIGSITRYIPIHSAWNRTYMRQKVFAAAPRLESADLRGAANNWLHNLYRSATPQSYSLWSRFSIIIHADWRQLVWSWQSFGYPTFELMRVMTSTLTFQHILDVVYISLKKPSMLLYSKHTKYFKKVKIFSTFEPSSRPISDFFTLFRKLFKVISWVKQSPKGHEKALEAFLNTCSCFMPQIHIWWSSVY